MRRLLNDRPHPNPLPQERGIRLAIIGEPGQLVFIQGFEAELNEAADVEVTSEVGKSPERYSHYLGERVGVRVGVKLILAFTLIWWSLPSSGF